MLLVSQVDRDKWNQRYAKGAFSERTHPSALLAEWIEKLPRGRALDIASGAGRNCLFLAKNGYQVSGVDVSKVGLERAAASARQENLDITWIEHDLDDGLGLQGPFDVVVLFRYLNLELIEQLPSLLVPQGVLIVEEHLVTTEDVHGPKNPPFCVEAGQLRDCIQGLEVLHDREGIVVDPDGRKAALARFIGQRPAVATSYEVRRPTS